LALPQFVADPPMASPSMRPPSSTLIIATPRDGYQRLSPTNRVTTARK
jgi:hypothetical protein